jgi:hypothetical protein
VKIREFYSQEIIILLVFQNSQIIHKLFIFDFAMSPILKQLKNGENLDAFALKKYL